MKPVTIRLQRKGRYKRATFVIVVIYKKSRVQGRALEKLGVYNPIKGNKYCFINLERLGYWLKRGATMSFKTKLLVGHLAKGFEETFVEDKAYLEYSKFNKSKYLRRYNFFFKNVN